MAWILLRRLFLIAALLPLLAGCLEQNPFQEASWPPRVGEPFPDITFVDHRGQEVHLADFLGKVLLVEPVGMSCKACNSLADRFSRGAYVGAAKQDGMPNMEELLRRFGKGLTLSHPDILHVQLILYDLTNEQPDGEDAKLWSEHFRFDRDPNVIVLVPEADPRNRKTFEAIPGVWLVDRDLNVIADATGNNPGTTIWDDVMPQVAHLVGW
jgi:hypothetical protein